MRPAPDGRGEINVTRNWCVSGEIGGPVRRLTGGCPLPAALVMTEFSRRNTGILFIYKSKLGLCFYSEPLLFMNNEFVARDYF